MYTLMGPLPCRLRQGVLLTGKLQSFRRMSQRGAPFQRKQQRKEITILLVLSCLDSLSSWLSDHVCHVNLIFLNHETIIVSFFGSLSFHLHMHLVFDMHRKFKPNKGCASIIWFTNWLICIRTVFIMMTLNKKLSVLNFYNLKVPC